MVMNNQGQVFFYTLMLGIILIVLALALAGPVKGIVDSARNETTAEGQPGLNCSSDDISNFDRGACIVADLTIFHFIGGLIFIAGAVLVAKLILQ
jgi:hypothetical protein